MVNTTKTDRNAIDRNKEKLYTKLEIGKQER